ncbi:hypothetical protein [Candidatus Methylacidiphilum infernorum]|uniref:hypothetical protein n=1 Tax=Candidatus Methylacidiphilum infernorum TaxID=511746 RepID=UPI00030F0050|nr:hypothetical protein [Candidatus Methylacidiphilum infernorum]
MKLPQEDKTVAPVLPVAAQIGTEPASFFAEAGCSGQLDVGPGSSSPWVDTAQLTAVSLKWTEV